MGIISRIKAIRQKKEEQKQTLQSYSTGGLHGTGFTSVTEIIGSPAPTWFPSPPPPHPSPKPTIGGGGVSTPTPTPTPTGVKAPTGFTGKVEEIGEGRKVVETKYYKGGREVGRLFGYKGETYAKTEKRIKEARFEFDTEGGTKKEVVELGEFEGGTGARISAYEMMIGSPAPMIEPRNVLVEGGGEYTPSGDYLYSGTIGSASDWTGTGIRPAISTGLGKLGFTGRVVDVLVPQTLTGGVLMVGAGLGYGFLPSVAKTGVSGYFAYSGTKGALSKDLLPEQRVASGVIGGLGFTGLGAETLPYMRGVKAKLSGDYMPVKIQERGFKAIESKELIGLIPEKSPLRIGLTSDVQLPSISPLKRGGFEVKPSEKKLFLGEQTLTTSQIGFFKEGKIIKLEREFFTTPQEPFIKIPETRVSRLGLSSLFKIPLQSEIKFGLPGKPQIGFETGAVVSRTGFWKTYKIGRGTELEAIKETGTIFDIKRIGQTSIKGQGVELYKFKTGKGEGLPAIKRKGISSEGLTRTSGEGVLTSALSLKRITTALTPTTKGFTLTKPTSMRGTSSYFRGFSQITYGKRRISLVSGISPRKNIYEGISGGQTYPGISYQSFSTRRGIVRGKLPQIKFPKSEGIIRGERIFIETPTFGTALGKQLGLSIGGYEESTLARTGLVERKYRTQIKLPTTTLWKVQSKEFDLLWTGKKRKKRK